MSADGLGGSAGPAGGARIIAILGAESTGKTQLAQTLAGQLQRLSGDACTWVDETLRDWCAREQRTPLQHEQRAIAMAQRQRIEQAAARNAWVVADTSELMTAVYSAQIFGDRSLLADALRWHRERVVLTLLTGLDLPWQADGLQRDGPQVREPVDRRLREALQGQGLPFTVVYGHGEQRLANALRACAALWPAPAGAVDAVVEAGALVAKDASDQSPGRRWRTRCLDCLQPDCEQLLHRRPAPPG